MKFLRPFRDEIAIGVVVVLALGGAALGLWSIWPSGPQKTERPPRRAESGVAAPSLSATPENREPALPGLCAGCTPRLKDYKAWPPEDRMREVDWTIQGIWSAFKMIGKPFKSEDWKNYRGCAVTPNAIMQKISDWLALPNGSDSELPIRSIIWWSWDGACPDGLYSQMQDPRMDTLATYRTWPEPLRVRYVDTMMGSMFTAFNDRAFQFDKEIQSAFGGCQYDSPDLAQRLEKTSGAQDENRPIAELVFAAYEASCREKKEKTGKQEK